MSSDHEANVGRMPENIGRGTIEGVDEVEWMF
jgi:hypothetical protein